MKTIAEDSELDVELQELYILSNHWLSDLYFAQDEIRFLKHVINKYLVTRTGNKVPGQIENFNKAIEQQEANTLYLKDKTLHLLKFIGPLVASAREKIGVELVEKFTVLESELKSLFESLKQLKRSLFSFTESEMRAACENFEKEL